MYHQRPELLRKPMLKSMLVNMTSFKHCLIFPVSGRMNGMLSSHLLSHNAIMQRWHIHGGFIIGLLNKIIALHGEMLEYKTIYEFNKMEQYPISLTDQCGYSSVNYISLLRSWGCVNMRCCIMIVLHARIDQNDISVLVRRYLGSSRMSSSHNAI